MLFKCGLMNSGRVRELAADLADQRSLRVTLTENMVLSQLPVRRKWETGRFSLSFFWNCRSLSFPFSRLGSSRLGHAWSQQELVTPRAKLWFVTRSWKGSVVSAVQRRAASPANSTALMDMWHAGPGPVGTGHVLVVLTRPGSEAGLRRGRLRSTVPGPL